MGRRTTSVSARRKEMSGPPFTPVAVAEERSGFSSSIFIHGPGLCCISWPRLPLKPTPPYTHTQSNLCAPTYLSLLSFPSSYLLDMSNSKSVFLTSESWVRWRVGGWGVRGMWDGGARDFIRVDHLSTTLRKPKGREEIQVIALQWWQCHRKRSSAA